MKLFAFALLTMAALVRAKISTDVRLQNNKVLTSEQLEAFGFQLDGSEVFLKANDWFKFAVFTDQPQDQLRYGLNVLSPQAGYEAIKINVLPTTEEVLTRSSPNISWFRPPTTWYAATSAGPVNDSIIVNCMIPRAAVSGVYNLKVDTDSETHVNETRLLIQPDLARP